MLGHSSNRIRANASKSRAENALDIDVALGAVGFFLGRSCGRLRCAVGARSGRSRLPQALLRDSTATRTCAVWRRGRADPARGDADCAFSPQGGDPEVAGVKVFLRIDDGNRTLWAHHGDQPYGPSAGARRRTVAQSGASKADGSRRASTHASARLAQSLAHALRNERQTGSFAAASPSVLAAS